MVTLNLPSCRVALAAAWLVGLALLSAAAAAETQGEAGAASEGSLQVSLTVGHKIRANGLREVAFTQAGGSLLAGTTPVCIGANYDGEYALTLLGSGSGGAYTLHSGADTVRYKVLYTDSERERAIEANTDEINGLLDAATDCAARSQHRLSFQVDASTDVQPGVYAGTLTLMVRPL